MSTAAASPRRKRRATAGKRMTSLVGKALEKDEAFWGHDTWEDEDSGNDSFRESDEDSDLRRDEFDSDFNDSESDREDEEKAAGDQEEKEMARDERKKRAQQRPQIDVAKAGRALTGKKKAKGTKRVVGAGINAGLVLNLPGGPAPAATAAQFSTVKAPKPSTSGRVTVAATRPRRASGLSIYSSRFRSARSDAKGGATLDDTKRKSTTTTAGTGSTKTKRKRQRFSQEELLLEAVQDTEPSNDRWLLARKRHRDQEKDKETGNREIRGKVIERFSSRRGYLNTVTFPEMDHVPEILARQDKAPRKPARTMCVVTGKRARYRDPRTGRGYYDATAFRELRRRNEAGEPLDQRKKSAAAAAALKEQSKPAAKAQPKAALTTTTTTTTNGEAAKQPAASTPQTDALKPVDGDNPPTQSADATVQSVVVPTANGSAKVALSVSETPSAALPTLPTAPSTAAATMPPEPPPTTTNLSPLPKPPTESAAPNGASPEQQRAQSERRDSLSSTTSSKSQRASGRRRKPSAKVLQRMTVAVPVDKVPTTVDAPVAAAVSPTNGNHDEAPDPASKAAIAPTAVKETSTKIGETAVATVTTDATVPPKVPPAPPAAPTSKDIDTANGDKLSKTEKS